jgi:hypothetical protein
MLLAWEEPPSRSTRDVCGTAGPRPGPALLRPFTADQGDDFYELVSQRANRDSFILNSNRSPNDWYELFPKPVVAESVLYRLINASFHVHMEGKSYRPRRRPGQSQDLVNGGGKG